MYCKSETDLSTIKHRHSIDGVSKKTNNNSLLFIIKLQKYIIDSYKNQLHEAIDEITHCKEQFDKIKETNNFDPDDVTNILIHHAKHSEDKQIFKNAIVFMQNKLNYVLDSIENNENNEKK